jgi:hypothetical protein
MLFAIGTRVRFRYTGERGTITARLDDTLLQVRLDSDPSLEIPAFEEDLLRDAEAEAALPGARFVPGKKEKAPEAPPRRQIEGQYVILKPKGLQLAFEPMPGRDGTVSRYKAWLVNDMSHEFLLEFDLYTATRDLLSVDDKIGGRTALELGDLRFDDLNDAPEAWLSVQRLTTAGPETPVERRLRIRPKQFFNSLQTAPILNVPAHVFIVIDPSLPAAAEAIQAEDSLRDYTRDKVRKRRAEEDPFSVPFAAFNVAEFAAFVPEIDLHIENLLRGHARLDKSEVLRIQLQHFQQFMEKAVRLGVPRVYIIHGVGEGRLREAVAQRLRDNPDVVKFKNEFHPKYGYGATEAILR